MTGVLLNGKHSFCDLELKLLKIEIDPAEPKQERISVPLSSTKLNLSKHMYPDIPYEWRDIRLYFDMAGNYHEWALKASEFRNLFHGREIQLILDMDTGYYYNGTAIVETSKENSAFSDFTLTINADPYKYERFSSMEDWEWDSLDLEDGIVREYRDLTINGTYVLLIPGRRKKVVPVIECSAGMKLTYSGQTYDLPKGRSKILDLQLGEGIHHLTFAGNGSVSVDYRGASL